MTMDARVLLSRARSVPLDAPLSLWLLDLSMTPPPNAIAWLSDREQARAAKFVFPRHRDRYLNAHIGVRLLLEEHCGLPPRRQHLILGAHGKPQLANLADWQFSLSYADDIALVGIDFANSVGVDIERERPVPDADALIALHFHPHEQDELASLGSTMRHSAAFLQGWTRKEACLKALGYGLSMAPTCLDSRFSGPLRLRVDGRVDLELDSCTPLAGFTAAWARVAPS